MDLDINYERLLQISSKEINMCRIRGEHNPMNELVLPLPPQIESESNQTSREANYRKYKRQRVLVSA